MSYGLSDDMFGSFDKKENYKYKNGEHKIRLLPPWAPNKLYAFVRVHWVPNEQGTTNIPVRCLADKKKGAEEICPLCKRATEMKTKAVNMIATGDVEDGKGLEELAGKAMAKATYLWQILNSEGQHCLLSLTYRGHEAMSQVIGFWWRQKKIDITNPEKNYKMYCNRTGKGSQTNHSWAVLDGPQDIRKIDVPKLWDLDAHHEKKTLEEISKMAELGFFPSKKKEESTTTAETTTYQESGPKDNSALEESAQAADSPENAAPDTSVKTADAGGMGGFTADDIPF